MQPNERLSQTGGAELVVLIGFVVVVAIAFGLEQLAPSTIRIIAITFCCLLLLAVFTGLIMRSRAKRRHARMMAEQFLQELEAEEERSSTTENDGASASGGTSKSLPLILLATLATLPGLTAQTPLILPLTLDPPSSGPASCLATGAVPLPHWLAVRDASQLCIADSAGAEIPARLVLTARRPGSNGQRGTARWVHITTVPQQGSPHQFNLRLRKDLQEDGRPPTPEDASGESMLQVAAGNTTESTFATLTADHRVFFARAMRLKLRKEDGTAETLTDGTWSEDHTPAVINRWSFAGRFPSGLEVDILVTTSPRTPCANLRITLRNTGPCPFSKPDGTVYLKALTLELLPAEGCQRQGLSDPEVLSRNATSSSRFTSIQLGANEVKRSKNWEQELFVERRNAEGVSQRTAGPHSGMALAFGSGALPLAIGRKHAARNHPTGFRTVDSKLVMDLLPLGGSGPYFRGIYGSPHDPKKEPEPRTLTAYRLEGGRQKTFHYDLVWRASGLDNNQDVLTHLALAMNSPTLLKAPPEYLANVGDVGFYFSEFRKSQDVLRNRWQQFLRILVDDNAADHIPNTGLKGLPRLLREGGNAGHVNPFGWHNFGDLPWANGYCSLHYDHPRTLFLAYMASGDRRFFDTAIPMLEHQRDLDMVHSTDADQYQGAQRYEKGWYHGNARGPQQSHAWLGGLYLHWVLTADPLTRKTLDKAGGYMMRIATHKWHGKYAARLAGWPVDNLVTLWLMDGEDRYIQRARATIQRFEELEQLCGGKGYVLNKATKHDPTNRPAVMQGWMHAIMLQASARYVLEVGDRSPIPLLKRMADHLVDNIYIPSRRNGDSFTPAMARNMWAPNGYTKDQSTHYGWALVDALGRMAHITGSDRFRRAADDLFESGVLFFQGKLGREIPHPDRPKSYSPVSARMRFSNTESKVLGQIGLFGMSYFTMRDR